MSGFLRLHECARPVGYDDHRASAFVYYVLITQMLRVLLIRFQWL